MEWPHISPSVVYLSVSCLVCVSHLCPLLKPFDGFWCHLAHTRARSNNTLCWLGSLTPRGRSDFWVKPLAKTCNCELLLPPGKYSRGVEWTTVPCFARLLWCCYCCCCNAVDVKRCRSYEESLKYHRQALVLCPQTASTLSAMGYTYALTGCYSNAVDCFHKVPLRPLLRIYPAHKYLLHIYEGRSINKLQNGAIPLILKIGKIPNIRFVGNLILNIRKKNFWWWRHYCDVICS